MGKGIRFGFASDENVADSKGRIECQICDNLFPEPDVEIMLRGYTVCPDCVLAGPAAVATEAKRISESKYRLAYREKDPDDRRDIAVDYRALAKQLRGVDSFENIPGGVLAVAIAEVLLKGRPRHGKAA